jgi:hypothetical protein
MSGCGRLSLFLGRSHSPQSGTFNTGMVSTQRSISQGLTDSQRLTYQNQKADIPFGEDCHLPNTLRKDITGVSNISEPQSEDSGRHKWFLLFMLFHAHTMTMGTGRQTCGEIFGVTL